MILLQWPYVLNHYWFSKRKKKKKSTYIVLSRTENLPCVQNGVVMPTEGTSMSENKRDNHDVPIRYAGLQCVFLMTLLSQFTFQGCCCEEYSLTMVRAH